MHFTQSRGGRKTSFGLRNSGPRLCFLTGKPGNACENGPEAKRTNSKKLMSITFTTVSMWVITLSGTCRSKTVIVKA